jgi:thiol-disulfide isomerase/thioredoxin
MMRGVFVVLVFFAATALTLTAAAGETGPPSGHPLPAIELDVPASAEQRQYLGLDQGERFRVGDIQSEVVIVEIFSMYCPHCQREAPDVNKVFEKIEADPRLRGRVKLIGIGAGNSSFEVAVFQKSFKVPFPLFPDGSFVIHKKLGEVRTPYFIGVRIGEDGSTRVFYSRLGGLDGGSPDQFLKKLLENANLQ